MQMKEEDGWPIRRQWQVIKSSWNSLKEPNRKSYKRKNYPYSKRIFSPNEACKYLGITTEQLVEMVVGKKYRRSLPYIYNPDGNVWQFKREDLSSYRYWLDTNRAKTTPPSHDD